MKKAVYWTSRRHTSSVSINHIKSHIQSLEKSLAWGTGDAGYGRSKENAIAQGVYRGRDPLLSAPVLNSPAQDTQRKRIAREGKYGADLFSPDQQHQKDTHAFYFRMHKENVLQELRQRAPATGREVGKMTFNNKEVTPLRDPADDETTRWDQDPNFRDLVNRSEPYLGAKPKNMREFEHLLANASAEQLFQFWSNTKATMGERSMGWLNTQAVWHLEGTDLQEHCKRLKASNDAKAAFMKQVQLDVDKAKGWGPVAEKISAAYQKVYDILNQRRQRQQKANLYLEWKAMTFEQQLAYCVGQRELYAKSITTGEFDPEDSDKSEEWKKEHEAINAILKEPLQGLSFSLGEFWEKYERAIEIEREHMYTILANKERSAWSLARVLKENNGDYSVVAQSHVAAIQGSTFDASSGTVIPHTNEVWCKLNWAYYGSGTLVDPTSATVSRALQFHHATPLQVKAIAKVTYLTRPLSSSLDYTSPHTYRYSFADVVAQGRVDALGDFGRESQSEEYAAVWETSCATVIKSARQRIGKIRRRVLEEQRKKFLNSVESGGPVTDVAVLSADGLTRSGKWYVGTNAVVSFKWTPPELTGVLGGNAANVARLEFERRQKGTIEISLWRKKSKGDVEAATKEIATATALCGQDSKLTDMSVYALNFTKDVLNAVPDANSAYLSDASITITDPTKPFLDTPNTADDEDHQDWVFVTMLHDNIELSADQKAHITLPFSAVGLGGERVNYVDGEYRLRVRCFRNEANAVPRHPARCVQGYSEVFHVNDVLVADLKGFLGDKLTGEGQDAFFPSTSLPALVQKLRTERGYQISIDTEFELGQQVTPKGEISLQYIVDTLRRGASEEDPTTYGLAEDEIAHEKALFQQYELWNPGTSLGEWMSLRRVELQRAFDGVESAWNIPDGLEEEPTTPDNAEFQMQYIYDKVVCLSATGSHCEAPGVPGCVAEVDGTGVVTKLNLTTTKPELKLDEAVRSIHGAMYNAHTRLNTLAHTKISQRCERVQNALRDQFDDRTGANPHAYYSGKYMTTLNYCYNTAKNNVLGVRRDGASELADALRAKPVDRQGHYNYPDATDKPIAKYAKGTPITLPSNGVDERWQS